MQAAPTLAVAAEALQDNVVEVIMMEEMDFCYHGIQQDMALEEEQQDTQTLVVQDPEAMAGAMLVLEQAIPTAQITMLKKTEQQ